MDTLLNISPIYASLAVVALPFLAFVLQALLGKRAQSGNIALLAIILSTAISFIWVFAEVWNGSPVNSRVEWFSVGDTAFHVGVLLNNLTVLMQLLVCVVALPVHIYSRVYMKGDPGIHRYWMYLSLFCFAMLGLTISINLLQMYIFWELVGFASYLLIGFWFEKKAAAEANKKAFIINRIGDLGFLIGIALLYANFGTLDLVELFGKAGIFAESLTLDRDATWLTWAGLAFFLGAMAKSAQFPLHVWLPDAMEGPTSVSSLIHAATMVAAGVFLLCSVFPLFNETVLLVITIIGSITAASAAVFALAQYDIKKVLAFSTVSQLGFMMVAVGIGAWDAAMFHLSTHAFFKCLLFLCAGAVIHEMAHLKAKSQQDFDPQDMRNMGGLRQYMPKTFILMAIAALAVAGFPLTSGFLSKDSIVVSAYEWAAAKGDLYLIVPIVLILVSMLTAFYIGRLLFKTFFGTFRLKSLLSENTQLHEAPKLMLAPMAFLAICSIFPIFSLNPIVYSEAWILGVFQLQHSFPSIAAAHIAIPTILVIGAILSWLIAWKWYVGGSYPLREDNKAVNWARQQGYLNEINQIIFIKGTVLISAIAYGFDRYIVDGATKLASGFVRSLSGMMAWLDRNIVDGLVNLVANATYYIGHIVRNSRHGQLQGYLGFAMTVVVLGIIYLLIQ